MTAKAVILDLNGTIYQHESLLPGVTSGLEAMDRVSVDRLFFSNNPTRTPVQFASKLQRLGVDAERCLVVGDRVDTDIAMGERAGMTTVLVLTGIHDETAVRRANVEPDYVIETLASIDSLLR